MVDVYRLAFASLRGITRRLAQEILNRTGSERNFFEASQQELTHRMSCRSNLFAESYRGELLETARREADFIESNSIAALYFTDPGYPSRLAECDDAPLMLYGLGECGMNARHVVSIVGTRHATPYGLDFVDRLIKDLSLKIPDLVIVSGLAYGIDVAAHKASMKYGVPTAAVLAHGLNTIYPAVHRSVAADMVRQGGILLTDYMSQTTMHKGNFLARNRIVAGLADCLIVAESAEKGGALVTANADCAQCGVARRMRRRCDSLHALDSDVGRRSADTYSRRTVGRRIQNHGLHTTERRRHSQPHVRGDGHSRQPTHAYSGRHGIQRTASELSRRQIPSGIALRVNFLTSDVLIKYNI